MDPSPACRIHSDSTAQQHQALVKADNLSRAALFETGSPHVSRAANLVILETLQLLAMPVFLFCIKSLISWRIMTRAPSTGSQIRLSGLRLLYQAQEDEEPS